MATKKAVRLVEPLAVVTVHLLSYLEVAPLLATVSIVDDSLCYDCCIFPCCFVCRQSCSGHSDRALDFFAKSSCSSWVEFALVEAQCYLLIQLLDVFPLSKFYVAERERNLGNMFSTRALDTSLELPNQCGFLFSFVEFAFLCRLGPVGSEDFGRRWDLPPMARLHKRIL